MSVENEIDQVECQIPTKINKRVALSKENYKKIKLSIETLEIDKKEPEAISDIVNNAIECYFQEVIVKQLNGL